MIRRVQCHIKWLLFLPVLLTGCASTYTENTISLSTEFLDQNKRYEGRYILQPGDQIEIFIYQHPKFSRKVIIRPDGMITLPLIDELRAAGKHPQELDGELTKLYSQRIKNPEVTVIVENAPEPMVFVLGEIGSTQALPHRNVKTVAQALAYSGGIPKTAALDSVSVIRVNQDGKLQARTATFPDDMGSSQPEKYMVLQNMALRPNDIVFVPESGRSQLMRYIQDFNTLLTPYYQVKIIDIIQDE